MTELRQATHMLRIATPGQAMVEFTTDIERWVAAQAMSEGLLTVFCRHTSASLTIQENAAPAVQRDLLNWLSRMAPEDHPYAHDDEGPDDMPAHIRSLLTGVSLTIPLIGGRLALGTWQGIYLVEHRRSPHRREVALHLAGA